MKRSLLLGLVVLNAGLAGEPSGSPVPKEVATWIQRYAVSQTSNGIAPTYYPGGTMMAEGRLGSQAAAVVVFTLEGAGGGNNYSQYLAVFWKHGNQYVYCCSRHVGGKGIRSVERVSLPGASIRLGGKDYVPGKDPMCCPSRAYSDDLAVRDAELVELGASDTGSRGP